MASVFIHHVVGDLTVGKPELVEFLETETVESAIRAIGESTESGIPVWRRKPQVGVIENAEMRQQRFLGILNSLDLVAFLANVEFLDDQEKALKTPVSQVVVPNNSLLREVDPGTRLIDALEMMKQGVRRLIVPKSTVWKGMSRRFSILYNGRWLKHIDTSSSSSINVAINTSRPSSSAPIICNKYCCLTREDVIRFLIGCLGALAPLPLSSILSLGAINPNYCSIEASVSAVEATRKRPEEPCAVAVVEPLMDGEYKIIGEISSSRLWKCDYLAAAWAMANLTAGQFVMGVEDIVPSPSFPFDSADGGGSNAVDVDRPTRPKKFSSRSIGFYSNPSTASFCIGRSIFRGRSAPLTCKVTTSLAAVMAQMLSHRATHVWVTQADSEEILVGVVGYADILAAVTKQLPGPPIPAVIPESSEDLDLRTH